MARKNANTWYIGGINGIPDSLEVSVSLPFIPQGDYLIEIISDGNEFRSFQFSKRMFEPGKPEKFNMKPYGGFVAVIRKQD
jgi:hypothetical protein